MEGSGRVINPEDNEPDLDDMTCAQLYEVGDMPGVVAAVLDDWLHQCHGVLSSSHNTGTFLDLLAAGGFRVTPIDPGPSIDELLSASTD